ncbi:MAG: lysophospholipid acyltransferase family protein [Candidatus Zixiibacteriota bacterium]
MNIRPVYFAGYWLTRILSWLLFRPMIIGAENVPRKGGFILASNHISYYDPPVVGSWQPRRLYFFAKKELFKNPLFGAVLRACNALPVKRGTIDRQAMERAVDAVHRGFGLTFFPEGTRSRTNEFLPVKAGLGIVAHAAVCPIVPAYLHGTNRLMDCLRRRTRMAIAYGAPLSAEWVKSFSQDKAGYKALSEAVMQQITILREQVKSLQKRSSVSDQN